MGFNALTVAAQKTQITQTLLKGGAADGLKGKKDIMAHQIQSKN